MTRYAMRRKDIIDIRMSSANPDTQ